MDEQQLIEWMIWIALQEVLKLILVGDPPWPPPPAVVGDAIPGQVYAG